MTKVTDRLADIPWAALQAMPLEQKATFFNRADGGEEHVLIAQQFGRARLEAIGRLATCIRRIAKQREGMRFLRGRLNHLRAMLYFTQPSSRTFLSFRSACATLGVDCSEIRDTSTSSEVKGETQDDSVRTFSSYCDLIIMRTPAGGQAERTAWLLAHSDRPLPVLNAGSGKDQHPTQAVLDIYTLQRSFEDRGGIDGKCIVFVGDLLRGRTVRSLAYLLTNYRDMELMFVAPEELQIGDDILAMLDAASVRYTRSDDFDAAVAQADAVYMTRVQDEWDSADHESRRIDVSRFFFTPRHLNILPATGVLLHPFPRRHEIDVAVDHDPRAVYWRQMRNGMWVRAALVAGLFHAADEIEAYARDREQA